MLNIVEELFGGEIVEVPEMLDDVMGNVVREFNKQSEEDIDSFVTHIRVNGANGILTTLANSLTKMIVMDKIEKDELITVITHLMMLTETTCDILAEKSIKDASLCELDVRDYIELAKDVDVDNLSIKDLAKLSKHGRDVITDYYDFPKDSSDKLKAIRKEITQLVYFVETNFIPEEIKVDFLNHMEKINKRYKLEIDKMICGF